MVLCNARSASVIAFASSEIRRGLETIESLFQDRPLVFVDRLGSQSRRQGLQRRAQCVKLPRVRRREAGNFPARIGTLHYETFGDEPKQGGANCPARETHPTCQGGLG